MYGSMKRVVSNPDNDDEMVITEELQRHDAENLATSTDPNAAMAPPCVVEYGDDEHGHSAPSIPLAHILPEHESRISTAGSSLSSDQSEQSDQLDDPMDTTSSKEGGSFAPVVIPNNPNIPLTYRGGRGLPRTDSKMSAESSASSVRASRDGSGNWGWFEDVHGNGDGASNENRKKQKQKKGGGLLQHFGGVVSATLNPLPPASIEDSAAAMAITAPNYVLEESISSQKLWKISAGNRPPQPAEERAFYEKMWSQNFARSQVNYQMPPEVLTAASPISLSPFAEGNFDGDGRGAEISNYNLAGGGGSTNKSASRGVAEVINRNYDGNKDYTTRALEPHQQHQTINKKVKGSGSDVDLTVLVKGDNVFGTTVSKSFHYSTKEGGPIEGVETVNISIASYRVVESKNHGKYAQFLVIYREGSIRDTIGVWKRYSAFKELSDHVTQAHESCSSIIANVSPLAMTEEHEVEHMPNAITSWRLLKKRQRWYRCLDAGYLSLKVFLLERFLHDILFESSTPTLLREFVGTEAITEAMGT